jgi:hypothetical protein
MNKLPTKLLEYLVKQCTKEVLDQITEEQKLKIKFAKEKEKEVPIKHKISVAGGKDVKFNPKVKKISESDEPEAQQSSQPSTPSSQPSIQPPKPNEPEQPEEPEAQEQEPTPKPTSGPVLLNPKDKSKLQPVKFAGRDEGSIDRTLHDVASRIAGPKVKVSLGAKRLAREAASNPNAKIFFYLGKMDPESEEIFLMADKSLQIAKDESIQPTEIQGTSTLSGTPSSLDIGGMSDAEYDAYQGQMKRGGLKPRHDIGGLTEETRRIIKKSINKILDRK